MRKLYFAFFLLFVVSACQDPSVKRVVPIDRIDSSGVYISYIFKKKDYQKQFPLEVRAKGFCTQDSMVIRINPDAPREVEMESIIYRPGH